MFEIRRDLLLNKLTALADKSSVLITGSPGIGKSWLLREYLNRLDSTDTFVLALAVENYQVESLPELYKAIGIKHSVATVLKAQSVRCVLILDGLDAQRGEAAQRVFRELIVDVMENCPDVRVIVTIRSFDLRQSPTFSRLLTFSSSGSNTFSELRVDVLADDEIQQATSENTRFGKLWITTSVAAKALLRNPFNLQIALLLLEKNVDTFSLQSIGSQAELLDRYWQFRIELSPLADSTKTLLRTILQLMVGRRSLSIAEMDLSFGNLAPAFHELRSVELLQKSSTGRISLSHNIFFDYAVARLLLDERTVLAFVMDPSRILYFRPSIHFFFAHLWITDRVLFWTTADHLVDEHEINESAKIVPAIVIAELSQVVDDLEPLLGMMPSPLLKYVLNAAQISGIGTREKMWLGFLRNVSEHPPLTAADDILGFISVLEPSVTGVDLHLLAEVSRRLIEWSWNPPQDVPEDRRERLSSVVTGRLLPSAVADIEHYPADSESLVHDLLGRVGKPDVSTGEIVRLVHVLDPILKYTPELGAEIYETLYGFTEHSEEKTSLGTGAVLNLQSTRKQDYSTARYGATTKFKLLLEKDAALASRTAVRSVNQEVQQERPLSQKEALPEFSFNIDGADFHYIGDYSEIWDDGGGRDYTSLALLGACLQSLASQPERLRSEMIREIVRTARVGVVWKRLVETAANHPRMLFADVEMLLHSSEFVSAPDVTVAIGRLLSAAETEGLLDRHRFRMIESAILSVSDQSPSLRYESARSIKKRLLGCVSRELLSTNAQRVIDRGEPARENKPFFQSSGIRQLDPREAMKLSGIDPEDAANARLLDALEPVEQFGYRFMNTDAGLSATSEMVEPLKSLQAAAERAHKEGVKEELLVRARGAIIAAAAVILRVNGLDTESEVFRLSRMIALNGATDPDPVFDARYHLPFDHPSWGGPSPRIEAGQAVSSLVWNYDQGDVAVAVMETLSRDEVPAVRFQIARGILGLYINEPSRPTFWTLLERMLADETTEGVLVGLLSSLRSVAHLAPERAVDLIRDLVARGLPNAKRSDSRRLIIDMLAGLYIFQGFEPALKELATFEEDVEGYEKELSQIVLTAFQYVSPADAHDAEIRNRARSLLTRIFETIRQFAITEMRKPAPRNLLPSAMVLETIASRLYFAFDLMGSQAPNQQPLNNSQRAELYREMKEFINRVCQIDDKEATIPLIAQGAHYLLQLFNGILPFDPANIVVCASSVCRHGAQTGYLLDSLAHSEAVKLVEQAVADHREMLRDDKTAQALGEMLDLFIKAGWPEAITLSFKLEDAFR